MPHARQGTSALRALLTPVVCNPAVALSCASPSGPQYMRMIDVIGGHNYLHTSGKLHTFYVAPVYEIVLIREVWRKCSDS